MARGQGSEHLSHKDTFVRQSIFAEDPTPANKASAVYGGAPVFKLDLLCVGLARRAGESFHQAVLK